MLPFILSSFSESLQELHRLLHGIFKLGWCMEVLFKVCMKLPRILDKMDIYKLFRAKFELLRAIEKAIAHPLGGLKTNQQG
ncbi:MAG TPA: hypothetical protein DD379_14705 [Cyanobacteria bacterium UBA11162]|nr:hypothetical protein [Cyanobacteria bacterium UBA11162]